MKLIYSLEIFQDEKMGYAVHEKADAFTIDKARIIASYLDEYKQRVLTFIIFNQQQYDEKKEKKAVKAE